MLIEHLSGQSGDEPLKRRILGLIRAALDSSKLSIDCRHHRQIHKPMADRDYTLEGGSTIWIKIDGGDLNVSVDVLGPDDCCGQ